MRQLYFAIAALALAIAPNMASAQQASTATVVKTTQATSGNQAAISLPLTNSAGNASAAFAKLGTAPAAPAAASTTPAIDPASQAPVAGIGQPIPAAWWLQPQVTANGRFAESMHNALLMPLITVISLFVLALLFWVSARYRRGKNPVPSKTSHNTMIEVIWTGLPILILAGVFIPSFSLLRAQYAPVGPEAITVKATGNQWYWTYKYPDNGDFEIVSNMLADDVAKARNEPRLLGVDNRMLVPVNTPIKMIITSNDVIHSFAVPAFWTKMDAVPGRLNETSFKADHVGVYYGQCSALCGARHAYMPIAVEVVTMARYNQWVKAHDGKVKGAPDVVIPAAVAAPAAAPAPVAAKPAVALNSPVAQLASK